MRFRHLSTGVLTAALCAIVAGPASADAPLAPLPLNITASSNPEIIAPTPNGGVQSTDPGDVRILQTVSLGKLDGSGYPSLGMVVASSDPNETGVYVVFGAAIHRGRAIDIESLGADGYRIGGTDIAAVSFTAATVPGGGHGFMNGDPVSIADVGDLNGDGRDDLAVGLPDASHNGISGSGSVYVVYGQSSATPIDLDTLGDDGFRVDGPSSVTAGSELGMSVAGLADAGPGGERAVLMSAPGWSDSNNFSQSDIHTGAVFAIYSQAAGSVVDLSQGLGSRGFEIEGQGGVNAPALAGAMVDAGDQNGDGWDDIALTGSTADWTQAIVRVIDNPGPSGLVDLDQPGSVQFALTAPGPGSSAPEATRDFTGLVNVGDLNRDGRDDLAVSSAMASSAGRSGNGVTWVAYSPATGTVDLSRVAAAHTGYEIDGAANNVGSGMAIGNAGDQDGSGASGLLVANQQTLSSPPVITATEKPWQVTVSNDPLFMVRAQAPGTVVDLSHLATGQGTAYTCLDRLEGWSHCNGIGISSLGALGQLNADGIPALYLSGPTAYCTLPDGSLSLGAYVTVVGSAPAPQENQHANGQARDRAAASDTGASPSVTLTDGVSEPLGTGVPSSVYVSDTFQYGTSTAYGSSTPAQMQDVGTAVVRVSAQLTGLTPGTVYHYRLVALNDRGQITYGADRTFTAPAASMPPPGRHVTPLEALVRVHRARGKHAVRLDGSGSKAPVGTRVTRYVWRLGGRVIGRGRTLTYRFRRAGRYRITLTVTDSRRASRSTSVLVRVR